MSVQADLLPMHNEKTFGAMKAERTVKQITFDPAEASPQSMIYVSVPKLNENKVLVPGSLALVFKINLASGHANNYLDHQILTYNRVFYPQALYNNLAFKLTLALALANQVVKGSDTTKLNYKLKKIQLEYEMIQSKTLADEATSAYSAGKEFSCPSRKDHHVWKKTPMRI